MNKDDIKIDKIQWPNQDLLRIQVPPDGNIFNVTLTLNGNIIDIEKFASFNRLRNDVLLPFDRKFHAPDITPAIDLIKDMKSELLAAVEETNEDMDTMFASQTKQLKRAYWIIALCFVGLLININWDFICDYVLGVK